MHPADDRAIGSDLQRRDHHDLEARAARRAGRRHRQPSELGEHAEAVALRERAATPRAEQRAWLGAAIYEDDLRRGVTAGRVRRRQPLRARRHAGDGGGALAARARGAVTAVVSRASLARVHVARPSGPAGQRERQPRRAEQASPHTQPAELPARHRGHSPGPSESRRCRKCEMA